VTLETEQTTAPTTAESTDAPAAPPRRRRAASRPAGAPTAEVPAAVAAEAAVVVAPAAAEPVAETPAKAPRRRSPRKAVAAEAAVVVAPAAAEPVAETPAKAPRRRSPRKAVAAPAAEVVEVLEADVVDAEAEVDPLAEADAALAAPAIAMPLFQVPDPTAAQPRRRRAASRPAGPPVAVEPTFEDVTGDDVVVDPEGEADEDDVDDAPDSGPRRRRRRGGRGRRSRAGDDGEAPEAAEATEGEAATDEESEAGDGEDEASETMGSRRRRRRRRRGGAAGEESGTDDPPNTVVRVRESRRSSGGGSSSDDVTGLRGSTRLEAKKQRRREGREAGRRRPVITEAQFLARREAVNRVMVMRERDGRTQIGVLEDDVLVEHYVARRTQSSMVGNVYLGKVQNVLPSMEAAFIDIGKGRNAVLYAGEVNWDAAGLDGNAKRIEHALKSGESVLVQVTKDPIGHKGARLTSQISLPGRYLVYVPSGSMTGISRKLPDVERNRLKKILREVVPDEAGVIVRTAAEGASEEELRSDVARLQAQWQDIDRKTGAVNAPAMLYGEPDLAIRVVRDIFNEDFAEMIVSGDDVWDTLQDYMGHVAPDLLPRLKRWDGEGDVFAAHRIDEQLAKALDRKVWLPSGGSLVIDRTEAMTVVDVNTGKFTGSGGNLEETVTKNNIEAAEEIVRQLRLRDIGGIIVVDFIDMVLEANRDLVLRRLLECLGRDRTKHQVAEVTSLGLVQMTRKRVGQGLLEVFSENCEHCGGRGIVLHDEPVEKRQDGDSGAREGRDAGSSGTSGSGSGSAGSGSSSGPNRRGRGRRGSSGSPAGSSDGGVSGAGLTA
jgi:ribonuclease E